MVPLYEVIILAPWREGMGIDGWIRQQASSGWLNF